MKKWICCLIFVLLFCALSYLVVNNKAAAFDEFTYEIITTFKSDFLTGFYKFITFFASEIMVLFISLMFLLIFKNKKYGIFVLLNAFNIVFLNVLLKSLFMRDRPYDLMIITETGYSFPSGHAMASLGFYGFIIYLLWHFNLDKKFKILFSTLLSILIILIGQSRIYLGVHYASDILAGYLVSASYLIIYISLLKKHLNFGG